MMSKKKIFVSAVLVIIALAIYLRFYRLSNLTSLYWEEAALAYDSYSLLKTGRDFHGNFLPIAAMESFGDYKASFYFYVLIPFIKVFGLNALSVRLPSALAGLAIVFGTAILAINLIKKEKSFKEKKFLFLITLFLTAISPWAINFSRAAWESNLATAFLIWAINLFFFWQKSTRKFYFLPLAALLFILSSYTYHANKIIAPLVAVSMSSFYLINRFKNKEKFKSFELKNILATVFLAALLFLPLLISSQTSTGQQRFKETSIFSDIKVIEYSNQKRAEYENAWWARIYYHRYLLFTKEIILNLADNFSFKYLFLTGDGNLRHNSQVTGQLYRLDFIFLILAIIYLIKKRNPYFNFILLYILIALLPSSLATDTPHSLRTLSVMPMFLILVSVGVWQSIIFFKKSRQREIIVIIIFASYLAGLLNFWQYYLTIYPQRSANSWQDGYQELMLTLAKEDDTKKTIYVSREQGRPSIYSWFFNRTNPSLVQAANTTELKDQGEFLTYHNWVFIDKNSEVQGAGIVAGSPKWIEGLNGQKTIIKEISDKSGQIIWQLVNYEQ
ncbi:MAG: oligosaccharyl transferase STT3 subunit [candidate division TM6 bacterium GW2011_GWF2_28_16]|nr:MAG: oligosaccharyl transferase STT3 subunit [candidate division TM6 bacterium GW2011_GWF2_28_16]